MQLPIEFTAASREFYAPLESAHNDGETFRPARVPEGWTGVESGVWTQWHWPEHTELVDDGWKVHVSARPDRLRQVLDKAADVCFEHGVVFKHISTRAFYWWLHAKHAPRPQSGKFIAAYPAEAGAARRLMESLQETLVDEEGPFILSDRRFRHSKSVYYRYGAFVRRFRNQPDGTRLPLTHDQEGRSVPDRRGVSFHLPEGVVDPFVAAESAATTKSGASKTSDVAGFAIDSPVRYTNAGGTYRGHELATGRRVFVKEGRPHTGLRDDGATATEQLREEWVVLTALHALAPGLAPEPLSFVRAWEHEFLISEHVDGEALGPWMAKHHPILRAGSTADDFAAFYERCQQIISAVELALKRLHEVGYVFVDVSPTNVILGEGDTVRLIDFGSAHRLGDTFMSIGTPGFVPPSSLVGDDLSIYDDFGVSRLAQYLLGPLQFVVDVNPDAVAYLQYDLNEIAPVPEALWERATNYHSPSKDAQLPTPDQVAADPIGHLTVLREQVADALVAMADLDDSTRVFPSIPQGYLSNTVGIAYGTAGVVHALHRAGRQLPDGLLDRLRRDALATVGELSPGLYAGSAGIARVLSDHNLLDEARHLLDMADRHEITSECATLFGGTAGIALAHLALYNRTRDDHHVDRALELAAALPPDDELTPWLGPNDATGLMHGRCGVALMLQQVAGVSGEDRHLSRAIRLLHSELDRGSRPDEPGLLFPVSATDNRAMPYLYVGSAGMVYVATRCLQAVEDERLAEAMPRLLAPLNITYTIMPGLFQGLAGYSFTLADHAALTGEEATRQASLRLARSLFKYAVPHPTGVRFLGDQLLRYSAELWSGSAGVLLALSHVLDPRPDGLFTVDELIAQCGSVGVPAVI
jgi:hypothetical protein